MDPRTLIRITLAVGLVSAVGAAGCSITQSEDAASSPDQIVSASDTSALLKSTLVLAGGCTAAKVGPKQLLVAARCVTNNPALVTGKILSFTSAASGVVPAAAVAAPVVPDDGDDSGAAGAPDDGGAPVNAANDGGSNDSDGGGASSRDVKIADIQIAPSYVSSCTTDLCGFDKLAASDSADIAVIILDSELTTVPSIPVDLDPVGLADPLYAVNAGCANLEASASTAPRLAKTIAVPAKSVVHAGSPYASASTLVTRLAASYVVTPASGWHGTDPSLCKTDMGSPLFRAGSVAVAGVTANYTTYLNGHLAVTTHHTRVDSASRFKIGDWLTSLGATTIHSCSDMSGGCVKHGYDGGAPQQAATGDGTTSPGDADAGDAMAPGASASGDSDSGVDPNAGNPHGDQLPTDPGDGSGDDGTGDGEDDYADAAAPTKKKSPAKAGCSAAPGGPAPTGEMFLGLGLVLAGAIARRRRAR
jgi:MYXO-CTERM domain-containing protein